MTSPTLILGTAMWGWTTPRPTCFALLDAFYAAGGRQVDGATNYPINKNPADFRLAENILAEWIGAHRVTDLQVMMKIGSLNNLRTPENNLSQSFVLFCLDNYLGLLGDNLDTLMVHWDNRQHAYEIRDTLAGLQVAQQQAGLRVGLSGIRHPELYAAQLADFPLDFSIQIKHNLLHSDYPRYAPFHGQPRFIAYGINAGGLKLDPAAYGADASLLARGQDPLADEPPLAAQLRQWLAALPAGDQPPRPTTMNHLGMLYAWYQPDLAGILVGPSRTAQLADTFHWAHLLSQFDYRPWYQQLVKLATHKPPMP